MKIGMLFAGYGSQYVGMGKDLYDISRIVQEHFEEASNCLGENFVKLCFASSDMELSKINNAYPALFLVSVSITALLKEKGIVPEIVSGCDIGALSALSSVGGLSVPDGLYLLNKLSQFYQETFAQIDEIGLIRIQGMPRDILKDECAAVSLNVAPVSIALRYSQTDHVVGGHRQAIDALENQLAGQQGVKIVECSSALGLHSSLMNPVMEQLVVYLTKVDFHDSAIPFVTGVDAQIVQSGEDIKQAIVKQICHPILMDDVLEQFSSCDLILAVGPGNLLCSLARERFPDKQVVSVCKQSDVDHVLSLLEIDNPKDESSDDDNSTVSESDIL